jgi:hypothetical protein
MCSSAGVSSASFTARSLAAGSVFSEATVAGRAGHQLKPKAAGKVWGLAGVAQKDPSVPFRAPSLTVVSDPEGER